MHYTGQLIDHLVIGGPTFFNPGTYGSIGTGSPFITKVYEYPVYNEVLGTFALLKSPKIKISKSLPIGQSNEIHQNTYVSTSGAYSVDLFSHQTWAKEYQIQLAEDLQYAINSSLDVKNYTIEASFNIIAKPKLLGKPQDAILNSFQDPVSNVNASSNNTDLESNAQIVSNGRAFQYYDSPLSIFNYPFYGQLNAERALVTEPRVHGGNVAIQTPYLPLDAFQPFVAGMGLHNESLTHYQNFFWDYEKENYNHTFDNNGYTWDLNDPDLIKPANVSVYSQGYEYDFEIELKLIVNIEFNTINDEGETNKLTQLLTYKIAPENINWLTNDIIPNLNNSGKNITQYKENISFENVDFHGQVVDGCKLVGYTYTCQAWNDITINGNVRTSNGFKANILAGNEIYVVNESTVSPEIILAINPILDFSNPMPKADATHVATFCQGQNGQAPAYVANQASTKVMALLDSIQNNPQNQLEDSNNWDFSIFPNPTQNSSTIKINATIESAFGIKCIDITGQKIEVPIQESTNKEYVLDLTHLKPGIYFIKVSTHGENRIKQIIKL